MGAQPVDLMLLDSLEVYEYRKNDKLCFRCGDKYVVGHQCKQKQLNCLSRVVETTEEGHVEIEDPSYADMIIEGEIEQKVEEVVCLNALSGSSQGVNTILVSGTVKNKSLTLFIDSGSTHSFIHQHILIGAGYQASYCAPVRVTVANGSYLMCTSLCKGFLWKVEGRSFQEDLLIIPLDGCDIVLGND